MLPRLLPARAAAGAAPRLRRAAMGSSSSVSSSVAYETIDVFTDTACGGNPLAVCFLPDAGAELTAQQMLKLTAEFNYSESTFVMPPSDPSHTARVRIFTPATEIPFAGHPNVGTAAVLARRGECFGKPIGDTVVFEEEAGLVPLTILRGEGGSVGATLTAPQSFATDGALGCAEVAAVIGLDSADIRSDRHPPTAASVGLPFVVTELGKHISSPPAACSSQVHSLKYCPCCHSEQGGAHPQQERAAGVQCRVGAAPAGR